MFATKYQILKTTNLIYTYECNNVYSLYFFTPDMLRLFHVTFSRHSLVNFTNSAFCTS
jgi:hypothetical protein